jgi:hypothetical protein
MRWSSLLLLFLMGCPTFTGTKTDTTTTFGGDDDDDNAGDDDDDDDTVGDDDDDTVGDDDDDDDDTSPSACADGPDETGPWEDHPIAAAGADITRDPYEFDAGVGALRDAAIGQYDPVPVELVVDGAIVTSRDYVPANPTYNTASFWFEDASGPMMAYNIDVGQDPNNLQPGDEIRFTALAVEEYFGVLEVTAATGFEILSSGNPVHVVDGMSGDPLSFESEGMYTVEVWGELVAGPEDCSANCFDLQYGDNIVVYRTNSSYDVVGDCIHFIGPLGTFGGEPQLDVGDFDWAWRY